MSLSAFSPQAAKAAAPPPPPGGSSTATPPSQELDPRGSGHSLSPSNHGSYTLPGQLHYYQPRPPVSMSTSPPPMLAGKSKQESSARDQPRHRLRHESIQQSYKHFFVLPVLFLEFLALALTRAVLPGMLLQEYGTRTYLVLGFADCIRGLLAFMACPLFGKLSDHLGRKQCLFITVFGTCAPVCSLALFSWKTPLSLDSQSDSTAPLSRFLLEASSSFSSVTSSSAVRWLEEAWPMAVNATTTAESFSLEASAQQQQQQEFYLPPLAIPVFVALLSLSGIFSSTFTLVFAYISDTVKSRNERVSAYGLALATFGLSFTIGPMAGGYLAKTNTHYVFITSLVLSVLDLLYIYFILPESKENVTSSLFTTQEDDATTNEAADDDTTANGSISASLMVIQRQLTTTSWNPMENIKLIMEDPFLRNVGQLAFFYYTGLWAIISTLSLYAVQHFHLTPERLGELMSALGLCTMVAEAVLVRVMVPLLGEKRSIRIGLVSFAGQCLILGAAYEPWHLFICVAFSLLGNLVYPSLSSLVSTTVEPHRVGEALGAVNGVKALTEGIGPLFFGALMTVSESSEFPGWPYWIAALLVLVAYDVSSKLPDDHQHRTVDDYVHELEFKKRGHKGWGKPSPDDKDDDDNDGNHGARGIRHPTRSFGRDASAVIGDAGCFSRPTPMRDDQDEEYQALLPPLSDIETSDDDDIVVVIDKAKSHSFEELGFFTPRESAGTTDDAFQFATPPKESKASKPKR